MKKIIVYLVGIILLVSISLLIFPSDYNEASLDGASMESPAEMVTLCSKSETFIINDQEKEYTCVEEINMLLQDGYRINIMQERYSWELDYKRNGRTGMLLTIQSTYFAQPTGYYITKQGKVRYITP